MEGVYATPNAKVHEFTERVDTVGAVYDRPRCRIAALWAVIGRPTSLPLKYDLPAFNRSDDVQQCTAVAHRVAIDDHDVR